MHYFYYLSFIKSALNFLKTKLQYRNQDVNTANQMQCHRAIEIDFNSIKLSFIWSPIFTKAILTKRDNIRADFKKKINDLFHLKKHHNSDSNISII